MAIFCPWLFKIIFYFFLFFKIFFKTILDSDYHQSFNSIHKGMNTTSIVDEEQHQREQVRSALLRHWTWLDRARLHTFHLWLFVYALAQIFLFHYLCHRVWSLAYVFFCAIFPALVLASIVLIRYGRLEFSRRRLRWFSLVSAY